MKVKRPKYILIDLEELIQDFNLIAPDYDDIHVTGKSTVEVLLDCLQCVTTAEQELRALVADTEPITDSVFSSLVYRLGMGLLTQLLLWQLYDENGMILYEYHASLNQKSQLEGTVILVRRD